MTVIKMKSKKQCCFSCRYYIGVRVAGVKYDPEVSGLCRRYPPLPVAYVHEDNHVETVVWPMVNSEEWCGEHRLIDTVKP